ncbi:uncharacterized protein LOC135838954 [Planococcus citri]|uniref:uncharacterized protein LOC135838954 n=1 Tax=Planococcus citri TaxID=170843 RepID=UPI0031F9AFD1
MEIMLRLMFVLMFLAMNSLLFKLHGSNMYVAGVSNDVTTKDYLSIEYDQMLKEDSLKNYLKDSLRVHQISDFICACGFIRDMYMERHDSAKCFFRQTFGFLKPCREVWKFYANTTKEDFGLMLRGHVDYPEYTTILQPDEYNDFAHAVCKSYRMCTYHIYNNPRTVQVIEKLQNGTPLTIIQMLRREKRNFLFTTAQMNHINSFMIASGFGSFPFLTFIRNDVEYAVPQLQNATDRLMCLIREKKTTRV